jgi:hypothetical protein
MQPSNSLQKQTAFGKHQVRKIITFLVITFALSLIFKLLIVVFNLTPVGKEYYILGIVWSPGVAAW